MSPKAVKRAAILLGVILIIWIALGGPVPYVKIKPFTPSDDLPTFRESSEDADSGTDRNDEREFIGDEYDPDKERQIDEMIEDAEDRAAEEDDQND